MLPLRDSAPREVEIWQKPWFRAVTLWGTATLVALFFTSEVYFTFRLSEHPVKFSSTLFAQATYVYLWAAATPLVLWLSRRVHIERQNWIRSLAIHVVFSTVLTIVLMTAAFIIPMLSLKGLVEFSFSYLFRWVLYNYDRNVTIYFLIVFISHAFSYYNRYRVGELRASQLESMLAQAQLRALKMQLHPHFLFNTLHSIAALLNRDTEAARRMIALLGDFLRLTLENAGKQEVTLGQEIEFLRGYLEIERIRFQDRLTTSVDVDPTALNLRVPNLILQPIVENAIRHGVATRSAPVRIEIKAARRGDVLRMQVKDNGPGLATLSAGSSKEGLGLSNTRARLEQLYGASQHLEMANDPRGGLIVTLEIPAETNGHPASADGADINRLAPAS